MKNTLYKLLPHAFSIALFLILACVFYSPLFDGYNIEQSDVKQHVGMSKEIVDYRVKHDGAEPLWTNSMFGGMPAYQISVIHANNWVYHLDKTIKLGLPRPIAILFWTMLGFYIFALCLRINPWLAAIGAVAFGFSTINILYIGAGHMSKVNAISYIAPALGGFILTFRGRIFLGAAVFALFFALQVSANHLQMTYYLLFILVFVGVGELVRKIFKKEYKDVAVRSSVLVVAAIIAFLPSLSNLLSTQEYGKYTTRGSSQLTVQPANASSKSIDEKGLNKSYILEYNYGQREILSAAFPNVKGGNMEAMIQSKDFEELKKSDKKFAEAEEIQQEIFQKVYQANQNKLTDKNYSEFVFLTYFGGQSMSGGAFYFGIVMIVFALLGFIFVKDTVRFPFLVLSVLCVFLASNDPEGINGFFIDHFPMYNKFRDSKMILVLIQIIVPAMALLFLNGIFSLREGESKEKDYPFTNDGKRVLGVCSGLSNLYSKDKNYFRALFILLSLLLGIGVVIYVLLWYFMIKNKQIHIENRSHLHGNSTFWLTGALTVFYGICLFYAFPSISGEFWGVKDELIFIDLENLINSGVIALDESLSKFKELIVDFRISRFRQDVGRALLFTIISLGVLYVLIKNFVNQYIALAILLAVICIDHFSISKRYFNNEQVDPSVNMDNETKRIDSYVRLGYLDQIKATKFLEKYEFEELSTIPKALPTRADSSILIKESKSIENFKLQKDEFMANMDKVEFYNNGSTPKTKDMIASFATLNFNTDYRVFSFGNPFNETNTSYFHKSIGGYHGAKLKRFQELIEFYINPEMQRLSREINVNMIAENQMSLPESYPVFNMLNTKYFIFNPSMGAIENVGRNGNAWFVGQIKKVSTADEEMTSIAGLNSKKEAIVNTNEFAHIQSLLSSNYDLDADSEIKMVSYDVNAIVYESNCNIEAPAVFSEIYYPEGWNCYIDGEKTENTFRANYILRGALIPAGQHKIEWKFEPSSFAKASSYSLYGSILLFLMLFGILGMESFKELKTNKTKD